MPLRGTVNVGFRGSLLAMEIEAVRVPAAVGRNVTLMVQFPRAATLAPHPLVCGNSAAFVPVTPMLVMVKAAVPVLDRVTV